MANIAQTVNVLQAMILTDKEKMLLTPTYHVFEMFKVHQDAMMQIGLALLFLASVASAQEAGDFKPASTNVWGAEYPRVDGAGASRDPSEGARGHPRPGELLERAEGGHGEAAGRVLDGHHAAPRSGSPLLHADRERRGGRRHRQPRVLRRRQVGERRRGARGPAEDFYAIKAVPHGQVREVWYDSKVTGTWRHAPSSTLRPATTSRRRRATRCSTCSTAAARTRPAGSGRARRTSSSTT
jgi:hypothetical protein